MQAPSGYMALEVTTESITGHRGGQQGQPGPTEGLGHLMVLQACRLPSPTKQCQEGEHGLPQTLCLALSLPLEEGPSGLPRGPVVEPKGHPVGRWGGIWSQLL